MTDEPLGRLVDRYTLRFERTYPHPVERVWTAVTTGSSLDAWMCPTNRIDARAGGKFWMGFTEAEDAGYHGAIGDFREHELVEYVFDNGERLRFELAPSPDGTKLVFVHSFTPEIESEMGTDDMPFQQGVLAGFHLSLTKLGGLLSGDPAVTPEAALEEAKLTQGGAPSPELRALLDLYADTAKAATSA